MGLVTESAGPNKRDDNELEGGKEEAKVDVTVRSFAVLAYSRDATFAWMHDARLLSSSHPSASHGHSCGAC
jgi:hypothetical protein